MIAYLLRAYFANCVCLKFKLGLRSSQVFLESQSQFFKVFYLIFLSVEHLAHFFFLLEEFRILVGIEVLHRLAQLVHGNLCSMLKSALALKHLLTRC